MLQVESRLDAYMRFLARWRWPLLFLTLLIAAFFAWGMVYLTLNDDYRVLFTKDNPYLKAFEQLEREYTHFDNIYFILAPKSGDVFTADTLSAVEDLTDKAWQIPYVQRVDSVTNYQYSQANGDDVIVADLIEDAETATPEELTKVRRRALDEPNLVNLLISESGDVTGVNVSIRVPEVSTGARDEVIASAKRAADEFRSAYPAIDVYVAGRLAMNAAFKNAALRDVSILAPLMYLGVALVVFVLLRSVAATLVTVLVIALSTTTGMGLAGWFGFDLSAPSSAAPTLILTLAVADSVHILMAMLRRLWDGETQQSALRHGMRLNLSPVFLTSLTTVVGFLAMNFADSPPLRDLGNIAAMGIAAAYLYTMIFLPILLSIVSIRPKPRRALSVYWVSKLGEFVVARRRLLLGVIFLLALLLTAAIPLNEINDQWLEYFDQSTPFRQAAEYATENLTGVYLILFSPNSGQPGGVTSPEYLQTMDGFVQWLREQPDVVNVSSLVDTLKRLNMIMHGANPSWYRVPDSSDLAAQYLLVYEMSLPSGLGLDSQLSDDRSAMCVTVYTKNLTSNQLRGLAEDGTQWLRDHAPEPMVCEGIGPAIMLAHLAERNLVGMVRGTALAFLLISGVLMLALKSVRYGLIALIPNIIPGLCAFGIWGLCVGYVGFAVWTVAAMTLGLVVDDTVHFLSKYADARQRLHRPAPDAVRYAFDAVGAALIITSVILAAGFLIISASDFKVNRDVGLLTTVVIVCALVTDLLLLPPLLMWLDRDSGLSTSLPEDSTNEQDSN